MYTLAMPMLLDYNFHPVMFLTLCFPDNKFLGRHNLYDAEERNLCNSVNILLMEYMYEIHVVCAPCL